jgi:PAS domain S-box-containing protein
MKKSGSSTRRSGRQTRKQSESRTSVSRSEARFRLLADSMPQLVWTAGADGRVNFYNSRASEYAGLKCSADGHWIWEPVVHPDDLAATVMAWDSAVKNRHTYEIEHRVRMADGTYRWHLSRALPIVTETLEWYGTATDIHDLKSAEQALRESEEKFRSAFANASVGFAMITTDGEFVDANAAYCRLTGYALEELRAMRFQKLIHPEDTVENLRQIDRLLGGQIPCFVVENRYVRKDGSIVWVHKSVSLVRGPNRRPQWIIALVEDVTERKRQAEEVRKLNRTLRARSNSNQALVRAQSETELLQEVCQIIVRDCGHELVWIGYAEDDDRKSVRPMASAGFERGYLDDLDITWADTERGRGPTGTAIRTGQPSLCSNMLTDPTFAPWRAAAVERGYASSLTLPLMDENRAFGAISIYSRLPERFTTAEVELLRELADDLASGIAIIRLRLSHELAQAEVINQRNRLEAVMETLPVGVALVGPEGGNISSNKAYEQLWGGPRPATMSVEDYAAYQAWWVDTGKPVQPEEWASARAVLKGETVVGQLLRLQRFDGGQVFVLNSAAPIHDANHRIVGSAVAIQDVTASMEAAQELRASEARYHSLFTTMSEGFALHELICDEQGRPTDYRFLEVNPAFERLTGLRADQVQGRRVREVLPYLESEWIERFGRVALSGTPDQFESYSQALERWFAVYASQTEPRRFTVLFLDVTERRMARDRLENSLREKEVLLQEIHHRVKNNLQIISSLISLQADALNLPALRTALTVVRDRVRTMALVHEKLYQSTDLASVNFAEYADSLLQYLWRAHGPAAGVRSKLCLQAITLPVETAVSCGLILNELVSNALKHGFRDRTEGEVTVTLEQEQVSDRVCLRVRDDGVGLPPDLDLDRCPSLGLKLVRLLTQQIGGNLEVHRESGTEFQVTFPLRTGA